MGPIATLRGFVSVRKESRPVPFQLSSAKSLRSQTKWEVPHSRPPSITPECQTPKDFPSLEQPRVGGTLWNRRYDLPCKPLIWYRYYAWLLARSRSERPHRAAGGLADLWSPCSGGRAAERRVIEVTQRPVPAATGSAAFRSPRRDPHCGFRPPAGQESIRRGCPKPRDPWDR